MSNEKDKGGRQRGKSWSLFVPSAGQMHVQEPYITRLSCMKTWVLLNPVDSEVLSSTEQELVRETHMEGDVWQQDKKNKVFYCDLKHVIAISVFTRVQPGSVRWACFITVTSPAQYGHVWEVVYKTVWIRGMCTKWDPSSLFTTAGTERRWVLTFGRERRGVKSDTNKVETLIWGIYDEAEAAPSERKGEAEPMELKMLQKIAFKRN